MTLLLHYHPNPPKTSPQIFPSPRRSEVSVFLRKFYRFTPRLLPPPSPLLLPLSSPVILLIVMVMDSAVRDQNATNLIDEKEITERSQRRGG